MTLQTSVEHLAPDTAVVTLTGSLTLGSNLKMADAQLQKLVENGVCRMVLDLTSVPYIDSSGLGTLVHMYGLTRQKNGNMRLCGVTRPVADLLKLTGMDAVLPADSDAATSLAALRVTSV